MENSSVANRTALLPKSAQLYPWCLVENGSIKSWPWAAVPTSQLFYRAHWFWICIFYSTIILCWCMVACLYVPAVYRTKKLSHSSRVMDPLLSVSNSSLMWSRKCLQEVNWCTWLWKEISSVWFSSMQPFPSLSKCWNHLYNRCLCVSLDTVWLRGERGEGGMWIDDVMFSIHVHTLGKLLGEQ